ncbi:MAG: glutamate racemase [Candidatus Ratteibacteria bacterium]|nr:glutamate racemase [Candidatus Ratteibacteria bacterium]
MKTIKPIGMFDSGVGGLTLFKGIKTLLPNENLIYFGDTARLPYGTKSPKVIKNFSLQIARFLENLGIKVLVVACHTASSTALGDLKKKIKIPVIGVIEPAAQKAVAMTKNNKIGVIGTKTTIESASYQSFIKKTNPKIMITTVAAPLLVPLVEEGWVDKNVTRTILKEYILPFKKAKIDTLILGCTHYPLLKRLFQEELEPGVTLIDTSFETAFHLKQLLNENSLRNTTIMHRHYKFYVSDDPDKFALSARFFLREKIGTVKHIVLDE